MSEPVNNQPQNQGQSEPQDLNTDPESFFQQEITEEAEKIVGEAPKQKTGFETHPKDWMPQNPINEPQLNISHGSEPANPQAQSNPPSVKPQAASGFDSFTDNNPQVGNTAPVNQQTSGQGFFDQKPASPTPSNSQSSFFEESNQSQVQPDNSFFASQTHQRKDAAPANAQQAFFSDESNQAPVNSPNQPREIPPPVAPAPNPDTPLNPPANQIGENHQLPQANTNQAQAPLPDQTANMDFGRAPRDINPFKKPEDDRPPLTAKPNLPPRQNPNLQVPNPQLLPQSNLTPSAPAEAEDHTEEETASKESSPKPKVNFKKLNEIVENPDFQALIQLMVMEAKEIVLQPLDFFAKPVDKGDITQPAIFLAACAMIGGLVNGFVHLNLFYTVKFVFVSVLFTFVATFMITRLFTLYGSAKTFGENFRVMAYSQVSLLILGLQTGLLAIPAGIATLIYSVYLQKLGMETLHPNFPKNKTLAILGGVAFFFAIVGNALPLKP